MSKNISTKKEALREQFITLRNLLSKKEVQKRSRAICQKIVSFERTKHASNIGLYFPVNNEVDTKTLVENLIYSNKRIYLPKKFNESYNFVLFKSFSDLEIGPYQIPQPKSEAMATNLDLIFVPAIAFDILGFRLGYGKGVYDKLLAKIGGIKIGLCYDFQIVDVLPKDDFDLPVNYVFTESRIISG